MDPALIRGRLSAAVQDIDELIEVAEAAIELVEAIEREDPDWMLAYGWLKDAVGYLSPEETEEGERLWAEGTRGSETRAQNGQPVPLPHVRGLAGARRGYL